MEFTNSHSEVNVISDYRPHLRVWIFFFLRVKFLLRNYWQTFSPFFLKLIISMPKETEDFPKFTGLFASLRKPKMFSCKEEWPDIAKNSLKPKCLNISFFFPWSLRIHIPRCMPSCDIYMFFFSFHLLLFIRILLQKDCYCIWLYLCSGKGNSFYYCTYFPILKILINLSSNLPFSLSSFPSFFPSYFTCFSSSFGANITEIFPFFIFCHSLHFFPTSCCRSVYSVLWGVCINLRVSLIQTTTLLEHQHWHLSRVQDQAEFTFKKETFTE